MIQNELPEKMRLSRLLAMRVPDIRWGFLTQATLERATRAGPNVNAVLTDDRAHSARGSEFPQVLCDGSATGSLFHFQLAVPKGGQRELEEERRLMYVCARR